MARKFSVLVERDSEGYYVASVPALPGCHTQAKSLDRPIVESSPAGSAVSRFERRHQATLWNLNAVPANPIRWP